MKLSGIAHRQQPRKGDCLPACAAMVLTALGDPVEYERLRQRLGTTPTGTPFSQIKRLRSWWLAVECGQGNLATLRHHLAAGRPVIVAVATELLPYWLIRPDIEEEERLTEHAVVVVGLEDQVVSVDDPDFQEVPQVVELGWFEDAWQGQNYRYAVLRRRWAWRR